MIRVSVKECDGCGTCVGVCPSDALLLEETISVNAGACSGCGICIRVCPFGALSFMPGASAAKKDGAA